VLLLKIKLVSFLISAEQLTNKKKPPDFLLFINYTSEGKKQKSDKPQKEQHRAALSKLLPTDTHNTDNFTISFDVFGFHVVQQGTTLTNHF